MARKFKLEFLRFTFTFITSADVSKVQIWPIFARRLVVDDVVVDDVVVADVVVDDVFADDVFVDDRSFSSKSC